MWMLVAAAAWAAHGLEPVRAFTEAVTVSAARIETDRSVPAQQTIDSAEIRTLTSLLSNDPMRAIQAMPGVTTGDDFRSEFAVRGSGFHHMRVTVDGVPTAFLLHTVQQVRDGGSIAMLNADVLSGVTLLYGSYPQRHGDRLGAEIDFEIREGARDRLRARVAVSGTDSSLVLEGPLGRSRRASWLLSARKSYLDFLLERITDEENFGFGFADAQAKIVIDATSRHRFHLTAIAGTSKLDQSGRSSGRNFLDTGRNAAQLLVSGWQFTLSPATLIQQRVAVSANQFRNTNPAGRELGHGAGLDLTWRADVRHARGAWQLETGTQLQRQSREVLDQRWATQTRSVLVDQYDERALWSSGYGQARWQGSRGSLTAGMRVDHWSLTSDSGASPWVIGDVALGRGFTVRAGAGVHRQMPSFEHVSGMTGGIDVRPARALHADLGIAHRMGRMVTWQLTVYRRRERDVLRTVPFQFRACAEAPDVICGISQPWESALDGRAKGVEALLQRRAASGLTGWLSYAYGRARYRDRVLHETFDSDFDQRHTVNAYAAYLIGQTTFAIRFRSGSNFPAPGYYQGSNGTYTLGPERNTLRVPAYARLDLRAGRRFAIAGRRVTLFAEVINALDHENARFITPDIDPRTSAVFNLFESMLPRLPSAGLVIEL